jgi:hypothetical protein
MDISSILSKIQISILGIIGLFILIIIGLSFFYNLIVSGMRELYYSIITGIGNLYRSIICLIQNNGICLFRVWIKFVFFFIIFIFFLINIRFLWPIQTGSVLINQTYAQLNASLLYDHYSSSVYSCNGIPNCLTEIIAIIGIFGAYCYFFDYLKNKGQNMLIKGESLEKNYSLFFYSLLISSLIGVCFIFSNFYGWLGNTPDQLINGELFFFIVVLAIVIVNTLFVGLCTSHRIDGYYNQLITRNRYSNEFRKNNFSLIFVLLFFFTIELPIFGIISGYNTISIFCIELFILFFMFTLAILSTPQIKRVNIECFNITNRDNVFILKSDPSFIEIVGNNDIVEKIPIHSIILMSENNINQITYDSTTEDQSLTQRIICNSKKLNEKTFFAASFFALLIHNFSAGFFLKEIPLLGDPLVLIFVTGVFLILLGLFLFAIVMTISLFGNRDDTNSS